MTSTPMTADDRVAAALHENVNEKVWWHVVLPPFPSTGGIAQVMSCVVCGASVTITREDSTAAATHIGWHSEMEADR